ncbi:MAG: hypothetical protein JNK82_44025, partial [Myxococcaceae bacterium]|nr:hypothetical protein [Myxococcaceae bacterium]
YFYGPSADVLWAAIEPLLSGVPFMMGASVKLRYGGPGTSFEATRILT